MSKSPSRFIVTTTINPPSEAIYRFCQKKDWHFIVVGDTKTPHDAYRKLEKLHSHFLYLDPKDQEKKYRKVSDAIGWQSIQRRNIGFIEAYHQGADIVASVDDDNIPYDEWGNEVYIGRNIEIDLYEPQKDVFDPLSVTNVDQVWHRGFPLDLVPVRHQNIYKGKIKRKVLIQANLWDGDPDIDAIARLSLKPLVKFNPAIQPYGATTLSPFNSQNTFLARKVLPYYAVLPFIGRMDDIWGSYIAQYYFPASLIFHKATVYQDRNKQDLITNLENEIFGYRHTTSFLKHLAHFMSQLPTKTQVFWQTYRQCF